MINLLVTLFITKLYARNIFTCKLLTKNPSINSQLLKNLFFNDFYFLKYLQLPPNNAIQLLIRLLTKRYNFEGKYEKEF